MKPPNSARRALVAATLLAFSLPPASATTIPPIARRALVARYNPVRTGSGSFTSSAPTPMQVGNGHFAFGADAAGLQTFLPFATMADWGWKNDSLPAGLTREGLEAYEGVVWDGVQYEFGGPEPAQQWLIANPNRANLGRVGMRFLEDVGGDGLAGTEAEVEAGDLEDVRQELDLWTGVLTSTFRWAGENVTVRTVAGQESDAIAVTVSSPLVRSGRLGLFLDFPWNDGSQKFDAPFVGTYNMTANHTTVLTTSGGGAGVRATIAHTMGDTTFFTTVGGGSEFGVERVSPDAHRYNIVPKDPASMFAVSIAYSPQKLSSLPRAETIESDSESAWEDFWSNHGFVDVASQSTDPRADELQRRIILSQYLLRVNEAGDTPPQESGLVNNGWYGKFHMEMFFWHSAHWALWNNWDLLDRASGTYARFLESAIYRAQVQQDFPTGARWSKMTDTSGRSAPGEINELLIWQQPHPLVFAEYEYRAAVRRGDASAGETLARWANVVHATADWMAAFARRNASTGAFDLGPPMYVVSEDTAPNATRNPAFELAYWRFGLARAAEWVTRLGEEVPAAWTEVGAGLAPLPVEGGLYAVYEGIPEDFWDTPTYTNDHPALVGLYGWLPQTPDVNLDVAKATAEKVWTHWNISNCWGWDFPMLAMSAARNGETEKAIEWLLHPLFEFDEVGMPVGGVRVPTPYFPGAGALLYAVAMMAEGWDGSQGDAPGFPAQGWKVLAEGLSMAL